MTVDNGCSACLDDRGHPKGELPRTNSPPFVLVRISRGVDGSGAPHDKSPSSNASPPMRPYPAALEAFVRTRWSLEPRASQRAWPCRCGASMRPCQCGRASRCPYCANAVVSTCAKQGRCDGASTRPYQRDRSIGRTGGRSMQQVCFRWSDMRDPRSARDSARFVGQDGRRWRRRADFVGTDPQGQCARP